MKWIRNQLYLLWHLKIQFQVNFEIRQLNFPEAPRTLGCHIEIISNKEQDVKFLTFLATSYQDSQKP